MYSYQKQTDTTHEQAVQRVLKAMCEAGFSEVSRIELHEKFKEKLGKEYPRYTIIGACSPRLAYQAVEAEPEIGLLLPCNIIVRETDGRTIISAIRPSVAMGFIENERLQKIAEQVDKEMEKIVSLISINRSSARTDSLSAGA